MNIWRSCFATVMNLAKKTTQICLFGYFHSLSYSWLGDLGYIQSISILILIFVFTPGWATLTGWMGRCLEQSTIQAMSWEHSWLRCFCSSVFCLLVFVWVGLLTSWMLVDLIGGLLDLVIFWRLFILCDDPMATTRCKKPFLFVCLIFLFGLDCDDRIPPTRCTAWQPGPTLFTLTPSQGWERWKPR